MQYYAIAARIPRHKITYLASLSPCLTEDDLSNFVEQKFVLDLLNDGVGIDENDVDDIKIEMSPVSLDEYMYNLSDTGVVRGELSVSIFGNILDEILTVNRVYHEAQEPADEYWVFILDGEQVDADIDCLLCKPPEVPFEDIVEEAYTDIMYQVRRYHPTLKGISLHTCRFHAQKITKDEYDNEMAKRENYVVF